VWQNLDHEECLLYTCVVWITLMLAPSRTVVRWATKGCLPAMHVLSMHSLSVQWIFIAIARLVLKDDLIDLSKCQLALPFLQGYQYQMPH
jgi:hypothetical protein